MSARADRAAAYRIFALAFELPADQQLAYIQEQCSGNSELETNVRSLLAIASAGPKTLASLRGEATPALEDRSGWVCGRFRLLELLGSGGMGAVYRAERTDGVPQIVAVKLLRGEITAARTERFLAEARILARLQHPSIAHLIDVGIHEEAGWIAMELVRGEAITEYCDARQLGLPKRIELLITIAEAISLAHQNLIVHRDIKPTNVLVTEDGRPKLIDFGIATALSDATGPAEVLSPEANRLFTPHYAAPEQVRSEPATVATDVFGLGALAYRLLTGVEPYASAKTGLSYLHAVLHEELRAPSDAATAAGKSHRDIRALKGDLESILMKAMARDPLRRYTSIEAFADDLRAYQGAYPVAARALTLSYRGARFVRRRALAVSLVALAMFIVLSSAVIYGLQAHAVSQAREAALKRGEFLEELLKSADPNEGRRDITVAELLTSAAATAQRKFSAEPLIEASMLGVIAQTEADLGRYDEGLVSVERQLSLLRAHSGGPLDIGRALTLRGTLLRGEGRWPESESVLKEALPMVRARGTPEDLCVLLNSLGAAQGRTGEETAAEDSFQEQVRVAAAAGPALRNQLMLGYSALSVITGGEFGRYREAELYAAKAWKIAQEILPADKPDRLIIENAYARALVNVDRAPEAEPLFRDAASGEARILGAKHHDTLVTDLGLVEDLIEQKRSAEAATLALPLARDIESVLGPENDYAMMAWVDYGNAACEIQQEPAGLEALRHVEAVRVRKLPATSRLIQSTRLSIGVCLTHQQRYSEAEPLLLSAASGLESARGPGFRGTQAAYRALRDLYTAMNQPAKASTWAAKVRS